VPLPTIIPSIDAKSIRLRALKAEDARDMHAIYSDKITMEYWGNAPSINTEESQRLVQRDMKAVQEGHAMFWVIELKETGKVIGKCTLWQYSESNQRAEVGYILNREYWRRGLMTQALHAMIDYAFSSLGLHRLEADTDDNNIGSLALLEQLGFQREGFFRERWYVSGSWQNSVMLGLLKQDWPDG
jgi:RimJ/RimL family protein N-acetyltransferase